MFSAAEDYFIEDGIWLHDPCLKDYNDCTLVMYAAYRRGDVSKV